MATARSPVSPVSPISPPPHAVYRDANASSPGYFDQGGYRHSGDASPPLSPAYALPVEKRRNSASSISSIRRKSVPGHERTRSSPLNDIDEHAPAHQSSGAPPGTSEEYQQQLPSFDSRVTSMQSTDSRDLQTPSPELALHIPDADDPRFGEALKSPSFKPQQMTPQMPIALPQRAVISSGDSNRSSRSSGFELENAQRRSFSHGGATSPPRQHQQDQKPQKLYPQLQYHHQQSVPAPANASTPSLNERSSDPTYSRNSSSPSLSEGPTRRHLDPSSAYRGARTLSSLSLGAGGKTSPTQRAVSAHSYDSRRSSYVDLTLPAHLAHRAAAPQSLDNSHLQASVGENLSLLSSAKTLEMYRANAKKSNDPLLQYELAVFLVQIAQQQPPDTPPPPQPRRKSSSLSNPDSPGHPAHSGSRKELLREARSILERIANRLPQAQYYLGDAYASGILNKGIPENEKAFPLFVAASKHGHAEAGYRAALCYEFGWGCRKDPAKAVQFYRQAASKNHPGAMTRLGIACLRQDLGLSGKYREGIKWLKRATDVADEQYPAAPYELAKLYEHGFGDELIKDLDYAAQLYTKAAELGHADAHFRMGEAYERGELHCPRDAALSVHFYTGAAENAHAPAMLALCAWYLVGAGDVMPRDEEEAFEWAMRAASHGLPKAEYTVGFLTENGIGCRQDPLEANVWYVRAADHGDERAKARLKIINNACIDGRGNVARRGSAAHGKEREKSAKVLRKENPAAQEERQEKGWLRKILG